MGVVKKKKHKITGRGVKKPETVKAAPIKSSTVSSRMFRSPVLIIALVTIVVNFNTLFLNYALDDSLVITGNSLTKKGISAIPEIFSSDIFQGYFGEGGIETGGRYRPLSQAVFAIQYEFFGQNPFIGHLTNVILYTLTCVALFYFLVFLFPPGPGKKYYSSLPFIATLIYAVHPLHAEAVANIKSLDEILAMFFSLLTILFMIISIDKNKKINLIWGSLTFFLALLAKENAITFLAVIPLAIYYKTQSLKNCGRSLIPIGIATVLYFIVRMAALEPHQQIAHVDNFLTNPFYGAGFMERIATVIDIALRYLGLLFFPYPLTTDYYPSMVPVTNFANPLVWLSLMIFAGLAVLAVKQLKQKSVIAFSILYFFMTYSVVSNLFLNLGTPMNDRFLFMPSVGFALLIAWLLLEYIPSRVKWQYIKKASGILLLLIISGYAIQTVIRNADWNDNYTLFEHDSKISSKSARCNVVTGKAIYDAAQELPPAEKEEYYKRAELYITKGTNIFPDYYFAWALLGIIQMDRNDDSTAAHYFIRSLKIFPDQSVALTNLLFVANRMESAGHYAGALYAYNNLRNMQPNNADNYMLLARTYSEKGLLDSAFTVLDELIVKNIKSDEAYRYKGELYIMKLHDIEKAEENYLKALTLNPKNVTALDNLGVIAFNKKNYPLSLKYFFDGLGLTPGSAHFLSNIFNVYQAEGDKPNAEKYRQLLKEAEQKGIK